MIKKEYAYVPQAIRLARIKIQSDLIRNCISKSKAIITGNAFKHSLRSAEFFLARFPFVIPNAKEQIKEMHQSIDVRIYELKRFISISIKNLVEGRNVHIDDLFWFSNHDLRAGYILLYTSTNTILADYVLFLVETKDPFDGTLYLPGDIKLFRQVNHVLSSMKGLSEKELGVGYTVMTRIDILNELSTLKSKIKSQ